MPMASTTIWAGAVCCMAIWVGAPPAIGTDVTLPSTLVVQ
jgi:hypothetical protein